jgi:hypothetical protein
MNKLLKTVLILVGISVTFTVLGHVSDSKKDAEIKACVVKGQQWYKDLNQSYKTDVIVERCTNAPKTAF